MAKTKAEFWAIISRRPRSGETTCAVCSKTDYRDQRGCHASSRSIREVEQ
ncbi:MAG: hypothetical protein QMD71_06365 [bacterium]|nr:hypothetical protein [bacterium]